MAEQSTGAPAKPQRVVSMRTVFMTRFVIMFVVLTLLMWALFYIFVRPATESLILSMVRDALQQAGVSPAQTESIITNSYPHWVELVRTALLRNTGAVLLVFFLVGIAALYGVTTLATRRMSRLAQAARAIARGEYKQDLSAISKLKPYSEINELAEAIEESGRVHIREQVLMKQVQELQIKIDEHKKQEQVDELTGSEFFQELKTKAKAIRESKSDKPDNPAK
jgi:HAMP domain-containing protein